MASDVDGSCLSATHRKAAHRGQVGAAGDLVLGKKY